MCLEVYNELPLDLCRLYDLKIKIGCFQVPMAANTINSKMTNVILHHTTSKKRSAKIEKPLEYRFCYLRGKMYFFPHK